MLPPVDAKVTNRINAPAFAAINVKTFVLAAPAEAGTTHEHFGIGVTD